MDQFVRDYVNEAVETHKVYDVDHYEKLIKELNFGNSFSLLHLNICSVSKNFDEFCVYLHQLSKPFDIIVPSETFGIEDVAVFNIGGGDLFYKLGSVNKNEGVLVYVKNSYSHSEKIIFNHLGVFLYARESFCMDAFFEQTFCLGKVN